jgi:hypothetical protein
VRISSAVLVHTNGSGGFRYNPAMSRTFSMNSGSVESLKVSVRWGCNAKVRYIRWSVLRLRPQACAIDRALQCVA